jgi:hypothetical protein
VAIFGVASIFTSEVTKSVGNSTIILGPSCGYIMPSNENKTQSIDYTSKTLADTYEAAVYVRQCYRETTSLACSVYNRRSLSFTTNPNASCPFLGLCIFNDNSAFSMDTGLVDSHSDLGINARPENRIKYRRVTTCAPIHAKQWVQVVNVTNIGQVINVDAGPTNAGNYTFSYNLRSGSDGFGYSLRFV